MYELALFAGAGGGILGGKLLGWRTVCAVEWDAYAAGVLLARQNDGVLPPFPIWDDVQTFDGRPWRGRVDVVSGGFPCQDISAAGKGAGIEGARSGMWHHMARIIGEVGPRYVLVENSPMLTSRGLGRVLGDLAALGYDARWGVLGASDAGAPHKRERIWIVGDATGGGRGAEAECGLRQPAGGIGVSVDVADADFSAAALADATRMQRDGCEDYAGPCVGGQSLSESGNGGRAENLAHAAGERQSGSRSSWYACDPAESREGETNQSFHERVGYVWGAQSPVGRVADGVAARVDRLRCIGNGQVPAVVALAWQMLGPRSGSSGVGEQSLVSASRSEDAHLRKKATEPAAGVRKCAALFQP